MPRPAECRTRSTRRTPLLVALMFASWGLAPVAFASQDPASIVLRASLPLEVPGRLEPVSQEGVAGKGADGHDAPEPAAGTNKTPRGLLPLFGSFAVLSVLDVHSTLVAVDRGGAESNPLVAPLASNPAALIALKAGTTATVILAADRLSRRHRKAAFALMIAANGLYAVIVAHNYRAARAPR